MYTCKRHMTLRAFARNFYTWSPRACWPYCTLLPKVKFLYGCLLVSSWNILENVFRILACNALCSNEKDCMVTTRDSFIDCIIACKDGNQMGAKFKERKVLQAASCSFAQSGYSVKRMFCTIFVPWSEAIILEKYFCGSSFVVKLESGCLQRY